MRKRIHMMLSVRGALRRSDRELNGWLIDDDNRRLNGREAREVLMDQLSEGKEVLPLCDPKDCPDFDYSGGGCPGHAIEESETEVAA